MTTIKQPSGDVAWYALSAQDAARQIGVDPDQGLDVDEVTRRLAEYGPNELPTEPPPSVWVVARGQLSNPMNIMLLIVGVASFAIGQVATGVVVLGLVTFNVVMGSRPGAEGPGQRGGAGAAPGAPGPGAAIRPGRGDRIDQAGARRRRAAGGR